VLEACHPSPRNGNQFVIQAKHHFSQANEYLVKHGQAPIVWE
jgi:uracil DNA glycosylase